MTAKLGKLGVVLFNLGGPDDLSAVKPFLFNLFSDPAIIRLPGGLRHLLAALIAARRAPVAREIYRQIGGHSPILQQTERQADALADALRSCADEIKVCIAMRYWHPFSREAVIELVDWKPDHLVLLPLYPQFSTTTTASSLKDWREEAKRGGLTAPVSAICCYPRLDGWAAAQAELLRQALTQVGDGKAFRILFSAHGLPKKIVDAGDPYPGQVEIGVRAILDHLGRDDLDWRICYQSRVGRLEWIGPATDGEIERAGAQGKGLIVVPVAFVSEHSETLVELDIEYAHLADKAGVPFYHRIPAVSDHPLFIDGLAEMIRSAVIRPGIFTASQESRLCPAVASGCLYGGKCQ